MAFSLYKRPPQLIDFLNQFPGDCRHPVTSTSDAKPRFTELSLGVKTPVTTSPFIDHSRVTKRKRLSLHQELVDAAKSFTLYLQPSDNDSITTPLFVDYTAMPISFMPPQDPPKKTTSHPTCEDTLKEPVRKKKITKKVSANEQLQIVCWDASATQVKEPSKKKRKTPPKIESGPVVKNEVTEKLQKFITSDEMNGSELKLVIQKVLYMSDLKKDQNRLSLPFKQLITEDFLTTEERWELVNKKEMEVRVVGPTLEMYKEPMSLAIWPMKKTHNLVLKTNWYHFVKENKEHLKELSKIQVWSFRKNQQLCFALAVVARPPDGINSVAN
ncbi:hypothetical protein CTI12_AA629780 [Artemisia annua]|uniref:B3 domain-containing protein, DNA-binding pseudobarrel domain protein n=1 Tax=Artemisia annua TaxID=35608 RepID=A0A2U1K973_ARTAN|nr:hypothetical protein CTI12_AA629780 [Artemisia annua]